MELLALILCGLAVAVFVAVYFDTPRRWANIALGLALGFAGLICQFVITSGVFVRIHW